MKAKLLFLDLDGTLFDDEKRVSPENRQALALARSAGCGVVVATGRALPSALLQARQLDLAGKGCYLTASNGAVVYDCGAGRALSQRHMDMEAVAVLFAAARAHGIHAHTYDGAGVVAESWGNLPLVREYCRISGIPYRVAEDVRQALDAPPVKVLLVGPEDRAALEKMRAWIAEHMAGRAECFYSSPIFLDVMPAGVNKGFGLLALCRHLGISPKDTVAAGDEANDIPMLRAAGVGAAMANAAPGVKAAADYVTVRDNNHGGVAEIVERFVL